MNQAQPYMDVSQSHMSSNIPSSAPPPGLPHYSSYQQSQPMQNGSHPYASSPTAYAQYAYPPNGLAPLHTAGHPGAPPMPSQLVPQAHPSLPTLANSVPPPSAGGQYGPGHAFDQTGQIAPPGMKPRVTATLWEDEGSLCFQVEANGVCVARREDNHMINGTKLLNVAGMTRGRRDGILKSEKTRHVVKIGPMHLKGVWIPFERALDFANKEKITEQLYPLFVHNIGALLYHPQNTGRQSISGATAIAAADRRRDGQPEYLRTPQSTQAPPLPQHHSMAGPAMGQPPHSLAPHPSNGRPGLDRAHTFPTPPASASSLMGMGSSGASYEWGNGANAALQQQTQSQPLSIDTNLSNNRSVPTTPTTTPPGSANPAMHPHQTTQSYDSARPMYMTSSQQGPWSAQPNMQRYGQLQPSPYIKNEMAPPARTGEAEVNGDQKPQDGYAPHQHEHHHGEDADADHEGDYTHSAGPYGSNRASYSYSTHPTPTSMHGDQSPRTTTGYGGYATPQRAQQLPSSNLYSVMSDNRNAANGADMYGSHGYAPQPYPNNLPPPNKRVRDLDDVDDRYSGPDDGEGLKRRRTIRDDTSRPIIAQKKR